MKNITVKIKQGLTPEQEVLAIAKQLQSKAIESGSNVKAIGNGFVVEDLETTITIKRVSTQKAKLIVECSVCKCCYPKGSGKNLYTNYGGIPKKLNYCSAECAETVKSFLGDRVSDKKVRPAYFYKHFSNQQ